MAQNRVVSLAQFKAQRLCAAKKATPAVARPNLPDANHLWELLDKNISLSVWLKAH